MKVKMNYPEIPDSSFVALEATTRGYKSVILWLQNKQRR